MNKKIGIYSAIINLCSVVIFAVCLLTGFLFGSFLSSMFIAYSFVPLICSFAEYGKPQTKTAGKTAMIFAGMYATLILIVYFTQLTILRNETLSSEAVFLLDYSAFGLFFNLNLLGYGLMSLSTFFAGFTVDIRTKSDKALKCLLMLHGIFFISCLIIPILGVFSSMEGADIIGTFVLLFWCAFFAPIGILSFAYFKKESL